MAGRKRFKQPFDKRGGALVINTYMIKQSQYLSLMPQSKVLMLLLQEHWKPDKLVDYGVREAAEKIPCDPKTARKAFDQLQERGFLTCMELAFFSSRTQSKSRSWRLEWLPFNDRPPVNSWESWSDN
jgi:hypothetical protein